MKGPMIGEDGTHLRMAWVGGMDAGRVGDHTHHRSLDLVRTGGEGDGVAVAGVHGAPVRARKAWGVAEQPLRLGKGPAIEVIEAPRYLPGYLQNLNPKRLSSLKGREPKSVVAPAVPPFLGRPLETKNPPVMADGSEPASLVAGTGQRRCRPIFNSPIGILRFQTAVRYPQP